MNERARNIAAILLPCIAVATGQSRVILGAELAQHHRLDDVIVALIAVIHTGGAALAASGLPRLYGRGRYGRAAALTVIALLGMGQLAAAGWWIDPGGLRILAPFCGGGLIGAAIWLFFSRVPPPRQPLLFGSSLAAAALVKIFYSAWAATGDAQFRLTAFSAVSAPVLAVFVVAGLLCAQSKIPSDAKRDLPGAGRAFVAFFVFSLMNCILLGGLLPLQAVLELRTSVWTTGILLLVPVAVGLMLRRDFAAGYRRIVAAGSILFLVAATLSVPANAPGVFRSIHILASVGQTLLFPCMMLVIARLTGYNSLMTTLPYIAAVFTGFWANSRQEHLIGDPSLTLLVSLLLCLAFHYLARKVGFDAAWTTEPAPPPATEGDADSLIASRLDAISRSGDLSPREREVVVGLVAGLSNEEIAADMHVARVTVETHVRNILKKLDAPNRHAVKKLFFPLQEEER